MDIFVVVVAAVYGLLVGSFLNVVIHRVPAGRSVVRPPSACPGCERQISARDNIPVVSWLVLRGRCRSCGEPISLRYPAVELLTAGLFVIVALRFGSTAETGAFSVFVAGLVAVSIVDLDCRRIPTPILYVCTTLGGGLLAATAIVRGDLWPLARAVIGGTGCFAALGVIWYVRPQGMGFGDVRLAAMIGFFLGWLGPLHPAIGLFLGFLGGATAGIAMMAIGRADRRTPLPFGPFLALGAMVSLLVGQWISDWYLG